MHNLRLPWKPLVTDVIVLKFGWDFNQLLVGWVFDGRTMYVLNVGLTLRVPIRSGQRASQCERRPFGAEWKHESTTNASTGRRTYLKPLCSKHQLFWVGQMLEADALWTALSICRRQSVSPARTTYQGWDLSH